MYLLTITEFIAHLHPALVHLPIGILLMALLLQALAQKEKFASFRPAIPIILLAGLIAAVLSCITGFLLYRSGDYDGSLVSWHMWMAITLTFIAFALCARSFFGQVFDRTGNLLSIALFLLIAITGHLGGSLTHGEGYLTGAAPDTAPPVIHPIADVQQAVAYEDIVKPILQTYCYNCHGPNKQKGGLRLDNPSTIAKGGKDGHAFITGHADSSELIKRMLLPESDEHHMPPKDRRQPSRQQQELLSWWIDQGADYTKRAKELPQSEKIRPALLALQQGPGNAPDKDPALPEEPADPADSKVIAALRNAGVVVMPLAQGSNYLSANFSGVSAAASLIHHLLLLKKQLLRLDLSNTRISDSVAATIAQCTRLRYLILSNTGITDKSLVPLAALSELRVLNLVGTQVTGEGLLRMQPPKHLHAVYLYHTRVDSKYWGKLTTLFKGAVLDSGGYTLPVLTTDTAVVRAGKR